MTTSRGRLLVIRETSVKNIALAGLCIGLFFYQAYLMREAHLLCLKDPDFDPRLRFDFLAMVLGLAAGVGVFIV